jgi:putative FmdB family regulatory protein
MPIFEYACTTCRTGFDALVSGEVQPECPSCHGTELRKKLSLFSVGGKGGSIAALEPVPPCHTCGDPRGPGSCSR